MVKSIGFPQFAASPWVSNSAEDATCLKKVLTRATIDTAAGSGIAIAVPRKHEYRDAVMSKKPSDTGPGVKKGARRASAKPEAAKKRAIGRPQIPKAPLIEAARDFFIHHGYNSSIEEISKAMGIARATLYSQFGSKEQLLREVVTENARVLVRPIRLTQPDDLRQSLLEFANQFDLEASSIKGIMLHRMFVADLYHFPDLARFTYESSMMVFAEMLTTYLRDYMARNNVDGIDPAIMAESFMGALFGLSRHRAYAGMGIPKSGERKHHIDHVVDIFASRIAR